MIYAICILSVVITAAVIFYFVRRERLSRRNMSFMESLNMTGLPIITFESAGGKLNFLLDSGSNVCLISRKALENSLYTEKDEKISVHGVGNNESIGRCVRFNVKYRKRTYGIKCSVLEDDSMFKSLKDTYGIKLDGILGTNFFYTYKYVLDFEDMVAYAKS